MKTALYTHNNDVIYHSDMLCSVTARANGLLNISRLGYWLEIICREKTTKHAEIGSRVERSARLRVNCAHFLARYHPEHTKNRAFTPHQAARIGEITDAEAIYTLNALIKPYALFRVIQRDLAVYSLAIC